MDLQKLSVAELDTLKTEAVQKANEYLATAREINAVQQSKLGDEQAAAEAERILSNSSPEVREKIVNALVKGETAKANGEGKAGGV